MAYRCLRNYSKECDGCGDCRANSTVYCARCGNEIRRGEEVFENREYETLCLECLKIIYEKEVY